MVPHTPQLWSKLLGDESTSDVTFMVGKDPDVWRFCAHSHILCQCSPVFHPMLKGNMAESGHICVPDVDHRAFENLLNYMYTGQVELQSVTTALNTIYVAVKYQVTDLMERCIPYLQNNISSETAMPILERIRLLPDSVPSAPPQDDDHDPCSCLERHRLCARHHPHWVMLQALMLIFRRKADKSRKYRQLEEDDDSVLYGHPLVGLCVDAIVSDADSILASEDFEDASKESLTLFLFRDSLQASELQVFNALDRWSISNCRRQKLEVTPENQRKVLGPLLYACRYLAMPEKEFQEGPATSDLLPAHITKAILLKFRGVKQEKLPKELEDHTPKLESPRQFKAGKERRYSISFRRKSISSKDKKAAAEELKKKKKKEKQCCKCQKDDKDKRKHSNSSVIAEYMIVCLATIFD